MPSFLFLFCLVSFGCLHSQTITVFNTSNSGLPDNTVRVIEKSADGSIWVGTDWGIARFQNGAWATFNAANAGLPDNSIRSIAIDAQGKIWIGMFLGGLAILEDDTVTTIFNSTNSPLPDNHVRSLAFDTAGTWIGTTGGLVYKRDTSWRVYDINNSILKSNNIASLLVDNLHRVWAGTVNGGLLRVEDTTWTLFRNNNSGLPDNTALDLATDSESSIWIASPAGGVTAFDGSNWEIFNTVNSNTPTNSFNGIAILGGIKYLSSVASGLVIYRGGVLWENFTTQNSSLPQDDLLCVEAGDSNCIWMGTLSSGVVRFCEKDTVDFVSPAEEKMISVFPVPASTEVSIHFPHLSEISEISMFDISGRKIYSTHLFQSNPLTIPLSNFSDGIYFLQIAGADKKEMLKLVKSGQ